MNAKLPEQTQSVFDGMPGPLADRLAALRKLIIETAAGNPAVGPLEETLKWGQPAYLTSTTKSGTTIRIDRYNGSDDHYAIYVHCQTDLVERYKQLYGDILKFEGTRAVIFDIDQEIPAEPVRHIIAMALTYHLPS